MRRITGKFAVTVLIPMAVAACGGGGSSSGGAAATPHAGTYTGATDLTFEAAGVPPEQVSAATTVVISPDGTVTISGTNENGNTGITTGRIEGDTLIAHDDSGAIFETGIICNGSEDWNGTVAGDTIEGTVTASGSCTGPGGTIPYAVNGTFHVTRTAPAKATSAARGAGGRALHAIAPGLVPALR